MKRKTGAGDRFFSFWIYIFFLLLSVIMLYPFWYQITLSLSDPVLAQTGGAFFLPKGFSLGAYRAIFTSSPVWRGFFNTIILVIAGTALSVATTALTGYALSKKRLPGVKVFNFLVVFTMLFKGGIIPTYFVVNSLGLLNTRMALILPVLLFPFNVVIMRNFFAQVPEELEQSAVIDGANDMRIFYSIILPVSRAGLATITLWVMVFYWNDFFRNLLYISDRSLYVIQMVLKEIISASSMDDFVNMENMNALVLPETIRSAAVVVVLVPILMVYPFLQKYFVKGIYLGSTKG